MALVHSLGRMHRDLKSGNILATLSRGLVRLKVADFGTATLAGMSGQNDFGMQRTSTQHALALSTHGDSGSKSNTASMHPSTFHANSTNNASNSVNSNVSHFSTIGNDSQGSSSNTINSPAPNLTTPTLSVRHNQLMRTQLTKGIGTLLWMAPEILGGKLYGSGADVYSYAIVLWEIAAQSEPWADLRGDFLGDLLLERILAGERLPIDPRWPRDFVALMQRCWQLDSSERPTFVEIGSFLS